jgi:predicted RNA-binding Zn-ribbon protein involved in translation (DUF1610 family)
MSVKVKGGMYCPSCGPVAAIRSGHAVRNTLGAAITLGLSLKSERWVCPNCGTPAQRNTAMRRQGHRAGQWRCEKNDHLLTSRHQTCPIDQSPVRQVP